MFRHPTQSLSRWLFAVESVQSGHLQCPQLVERRLDAPPLALPVPGLDFLALPTASSPCLLSSLIVVSVDAFPSCVNDWRRCNPSSPLLRSRSQVSPRSRLAAEVQPRRSIDQLGCLAASLSQAPQGHPCLDNGPDDLAQVIRWPGCAPALPGTTANFTQRSAELSSSLWLTCRSQPQGSGLV